MSSDLHQISVSPLDSGKVVPTNLADREDRVKEPSPPDRWEFSRQQRRQFLFRLGWCAVLAVAVPLDSYRHGLDFSAVGLFSTTPWLALALVVLFIRALLSAIRMIRYQISRRLPKKHLLILLLLPLAFITPRILQLPSLADGAARTLREVGQVDQMVAAAAEELAKPGIDDERWEARKTRRSQILARAPFSSLNLRYSNPRILNNSLLFEFGSPIASRWGFSISGVKGTPPSIPPDTSNLTIVSKEIVVFEGPHD